MPPEARFAASAALLLFLLASAAAGQEPPVPGDPPALPEGMTLEETLDRAGRPPPEDYPDPVLDDAAHAFALFDQLEVRAALDDSADLLGWEAQGWFGYDLDRLWWKSEGEARFEGADEGEAETDLLYSRLVSPFWNLQAGVRYSNEWTEDDYQDTWSAALAVEGLAPYRFELDASLLVDQHGDTSFELEAEYDVRITQRLVLQPRMELTVQARDVPEKDLGAGVSDVVLGLRLRYEVEREFAPYLGLRYEAAVGETRGRMRAAGAEIDRVTLLLGVRLAF